MEISGIPLHPLVVHAAVIFGPVAALVSLLYAGSSRWRVRLELPALGLALLGSGSIFAAWFTGRNFVSLRPELRPLVHTHQHRANILALITIGYVVLAIVAWVVRAQPSGRVVRVLLAAASLAVLVYAAMTGDAGARAVWT